MQLETIITIISLILISGFLSASELSFVLANKIKIEVKARRKNLAARSALFFVKNSRSFHSVILISSNLVNITFTTLMALVLSEVYGYSHWTIMIYSSILLLFFGELIPKFFAREIADRTFMISVIPVRLLSFLLFPAVYITSRVAGFLSRTENVKEESMSMLFDRQEIRQLLQESQEAGVVNPKESDMINRIIELGDQRVYEAMRPRTDIVGVEINSTIEEVLDVFIESGYSKLPVYEDNLDNIKGVVFSYDLFKRPEKLSDIIRDVIFVPDTKKSTEMLKEFLQKRISFAVAIDEFGGTAGILTMEDIIEELLGEIRDEYDTDDEICKKVSENTFVIGGRVEIDYINENLGLNVPEGEYSTIGGYITSHLGRIPLQGETVTVEGFQIKILRSRQIRIDLVKITLLKEES